MKNNTQEEQVVKQSSGYRIFSVVRSLFIYLLALVILIAAAFFAADKSPTKSLFGFRYYTVLTDSMVPEFASGDMVFVKLTNADNIEKGDIITFNPSSESDTYLTHRVTDKIPNYEGTGVTCFRTKGDANDSEDSFLIDEGRVIGTVQFHMPELRHMELNRTYYGSVPYAEARAYSPFPSVKMVLRCSSRSATLHLLFTDEAVLRAEGRKYSCRKGRSYHN